MIPNKVLEDKGFIPRAAFRPMFIGGRQRLIACFLVTRVRYGRFLLNLVLQKLTKFVNNCLNLSLYVRM